MEVEAQTERLCLLAVRAGHGEPCAYEEGPLWENGACALEKLTADGEPDEDWPDWANTTVVARGLLERDLAL